MATIAERARELYRQGVEQRYIAPQLGCTPQQVSSALKYVKIADGTYKPRPRHRYPSTDTNPSPPPASWTKYLDIDDNDVLTGLVGWRLYIMGLDEYGHSTLSGAYAPLTRVISEPAIHAGLSHEAPAETCQCGYHAEVRLDRLMATSPSSIGIGNGVYTTDHPLLVVAAVQPIGTTFLHEKGFRASQIKHVGFAPVKDKLLKALIQMVLALDEPVPVYENIDALRNAFNELKGV